MTRRGMTLIELVVVIALMAIIAGVSAPALESLDRPRNDLDAVATMLRQSRATAIQRATVVTVTIDPMTARYWVDPPDTAAFFTMPPGASLFARSPRVHFRFAPDGQAITDEPLFLRQGTSTNSITIEPCSGEVRRAAR